MKKPFSIKSLWLGALILILLPGCSSQKNAPVNAEKARETLRAALENWKSGAASDALQKSTPPIYVIDTEWRSGSVLKDYQIVDNGQEMDAQLYCPVQLTLVTPDGTEIKRQVTYMVSTAPNFTISRKMF